MKYTQLSQDEQDDYIAEAMRGRELEHFTRSVNVANYDAMLPTLQDGDWKQRIQQMRLEEIAALAHEDEVHAALSAQLPDPVRLAAAQSRVTAKLEQQKALQLGIPAMGPMATGVVSTPLAG